jgi:ketosteroid isomerase-like protein
VRGLRIAHTVFFESYLFRRSSFLVAHSSLRVKCVAGGHPMKRVLFVAFASLLLALGAGAQTAPDAGGLTQLLKDFLAGASRNDAAVHERFWSDDVIYTGSSGRRIGKADILRDVRSEPAPKPGDPVTIFTAEDIRIQQYGDTAIVAFRLVGTTTRGDTTDVANYFNTGTFLNRNGQWQPVSWQATKMPRPDDVSKKEVTAAQNALHQAVLAGDVKKLESLLDESFIWTHRAGQQQTRKELLAQLRSGELKYSKLETSNVTVAVYGDAAVVRGASTRQRSAIPEGFAPIGAPASAAGSVAGNPATGAAKPASGVPAQAPGDPAPFTLFYTLTLVRKGAGWKAVALHTSRP